MASSRQIFDILDDVLGLNGQAFRYGIALRKRGQFSSTQGAQPQVPLRQVAMLVIAAMLGQPASQDAAVRAMIYAGASQGGGVTLLDFLERFLASPADMLDLRLDLDRPQAVLTWRRPDHGVETLILESQSPKFTDGLERSVTLDAGTFTKLALAIANAPPVRTGRRRRNSHYQEAPHAQV